MAREIPPKNQNKKTKEFVQWSKHVLLPLFILIIIKKKILQILAQLLFQSNLKGKKGLFMESRRFEILSSNNIDIDNRRLQLKLDNQKL